MNPLSTVRDTLSTVAQTAVGAAGKTKSVVTGGIDALTKNLPIPSLGSGDSQAAPAQAPKPAKAAAAAKGAKRAVVEVDVEVVETDTADADADIVEIEIDVVEVDIEVVDSDESASESPQVPEPVLAELSINDAVAATLEKLAGPVSVAAIHTELGQLGRDEPIGHIEAALDALAKQKRVVRHGPAMWEAAPTHH
ncbi:MAG: hypothetical protein WCI74_00830 [Actinomycetes bacterium]